MLGISSEARFTENVGANFVACSVACLELFHFISLSYGGQIEPWHLDSKPLFSIGFCEFHSDKGSSKINKIKDKSLLSLIKSFVLKHGFHLNLKTTVLKRNNSNAHVRSIF